MTEYLVVVRHEGKAWGASVPDLPGLFAVGRSRAEVLRRMRVALPMHLELMQREGLTVGRPASRGASVAV